MHTSFEEAVESIVQKHAEYTAEAYYFMRAAIDYAAEQLSQETAHPNLTAKELYLGACAYALEEYGPLARKVLEIWGIRTTQDFGKVVYNLIEANVFGKQKDDTPADFDQLESLASVLNGPYELPEDITQKLLEEEKQRLQDLETSYEPDKEEFHNREIPRTGPSVKRTGKKRTSSETTEKRRKRPNK